MLPGDTVESVAAVIFPGQRGMQQDLVQQVIAGNPSAFPNGRSAGKSAAGTVLWFPDLREIRKSTQAKPPVARNSRTPGASAHAAARRTSRRAIATGRAPRSSKRRRSRPRQPVTLRRALALGDKPGPQECKQLMQLCGAEVRPLRQVTPALDDKTRTLESGVKELRLKQDSIDQQLQRLEQSLQMLQKTVNSARAGPCRSQPAPPPPKVEIRTVVKIRTDFLVRSGSDSRD